MSDLNKNSKMREGYVPNQPMSVKLNGYQPNLIKGYNPDRPTNTNNPKPPTGGSGVPNIPKLEK
jgi:hypothetical protein